MRSILPILLFFLVNNLSYAEEKTDKNTEKINREVKKIMEMMALPRFGLYQLASQDKYTSADFLKASREVLKYASKMRAITHPDAKFQKTNKEMLKALKPFEQAVKSGKKEEIKSKWLILNVKCNSCHVLYNIK